MSLLRKQLGDLTLITSSTNEPGLRSIEGNALLEGLSVPLKQYLQAVDEGIGVERPPELDRLNAQLAEARRVHCAAPDEVLNDIFVLERYVHLFWEYGALWKQISSSQFSESWTTLQNAFDQIRIIKRFSGINVSAIEDQLYALETLYPYKIFISMGAVVKRFECSICGEDIDSFQCTHRRGELYRGQMAIAIARDIERLDHLAMVEQPVDKRCVISYNNDGPQFDVMRYLSNLLLTRALRVSCFIGATWGKRQIVNETHRELGRNEYCYCGSGKKYKKCCIGKAIIEQDHVQIIPGPSIIGRAIA
jgi:hypothetical protein